MLYLFVFIALKFYNNSYYLLIIERLIISSYYFAEETVVKKTELDFDDKEVFYQSKYDYYKKFTTNTIIVASFASITYFISDCQLFGCFAWETLLPRTFILIPLIFYIILQNKLKNYRILVPASYLMIHGIMWCTIWAIYYLPNKQHASEGFIIMHLMFFAICFCAPFYFSIFAHSLVISNILISNLFNNYENLNIMLSLGIPCVIGISFASYYMEKVYRDQFDTSKKLEDAIVYDPLTQVFNRNKLDYILKNGTTKLIYDNNENIAFLIIDIDLFKNVNDTYGHDQGDIVLINTANIIKNCIRNNDILIRWGGEEFLVILRACSYKNAIKKANEIRKKVENNSKQVCGITLSIGVSLYDGKDFFESVSNADKALYQAKNKGRNCVMYYQE